MRTFVPAPVEQTGPPPATVVPARITHRAHGWSVTGMVVLGVAASMAGARPLTAPRARRATTDGRAGTRASRTTACLLPRTHGTPAARSDGGPAWRGDYLL